MKRLGKKTHGGSVAAPIFKQIAEKVLFHMGVSPKKELVGMKVMPDLSGMSVRDILKWSEEQGVKVKVNGSGFCNKSKASTWGFDKRRHGFAQLSLNNKYDP